MGEPEWTIDWSPIYRPEWDLTPAAYLAMGVVGWGRSRRLARIDDTALAFKAYLGVHHVDPGQWGRPEPPHASFFLSIFFRGRTLSLRTYPTIAAAFAALTDVYDRLSHLAS